MTCAAVPAFRRAGGIGYNPGMTDSRSAAATGRQAAISLSAFLCAAAGTALAMAAAVAAAGKPAIPPLDHAFVIILENHAYSQIIGNPAAPFINRMADTYNLATRYRAVTHPSLPNYLALVAGDYFGVASDRFPAWGKAQRGRIGPLRARTIADQLSAAGKTWKTYQQGLPATGAAGVDVYPGGGGGKLYAAKHNPFVYFNGIQDSKTMMADIVPGARLADDLDGGKAPNVSFIVPDQCRDMHGDGGPCRAADDKQLIAAGDRAVADIVTAIRAAAQWQHGTNAIFVVWDEDNFRGADNHVAAIVATNYGVKGVRDATPYTHYSLLKTLEAAFGLDYLGHAGDADTTAMAPLLAPVGPR